MKCFINKLTNHIVENKLISSCLFLFIFITRIFLDLIIEKVFGLGEAWQHYIFAFYKYNYLLVIGYMLIYEICYYYRFHKFHFTRIQWIGILYAIVAVVATYAYLKGDLAYDYYTKLSLGEMIMTSVFMFDVGRKLNHESFEKLLEICAKYYLTLTLIVNVLSLVVLALNLKTNFTFFGKTISTPPHIDPPGSLLGYATYAGFYYNTSITGPCCSLGILLLIWLLKTKRIKKSIFYALFVLNLYCVFLSGNRTAVIGLIVFFSLMAITHINEHYTNKTHKLILYISVALTFIGAFIFMLVRKKGGLSIFDNISRDPFEVIDNLSAKRLRIFVSVISIFKKRPLLGNGWNSIIPVVKNGKLYNYPYAHNIFLGALAWTGGIGFIIFTFYFFLLIKQAFYVIRKERKYRIYSYITLSIIAQCLFENGIFGDWNHAYTYLFWLIIGFLATAR